MQIKQSAVIAVAISESPGFVNSRVKKKKKKEKKTEAAVEHIR